MTEASASTQLASKPKRVEYIDLLRGWAVIVMIETHVSNATLTPAILGSDAFAYLKFLNGLVAPSFLFASGLAYAVTTRRKKADYLAFGKPLFKQFLRLLFILIIGYILHLPKFSFDHLLHETTGQDWQVFFQADVLHCIAVSLLFMQILLLVLRTERRMYLALAVIALAVVFVTPIMWSVDFWMILPWPIAAYLNGLHFSLFPLFPWSAFLFAGAITGYYYLNSKEARLPEGKVGNEDAMMRTLLWVAGSAVLFSFAIEPLAAAVYPTYDYWRFSPSFYFLRLGLVMGLCVGMFFFEQKKGVSPASPITLSGRESLLVYATHLLLIYGKFARFNFRDEVNHTFGYLEAAVTMLVLLVLMYFLARVWSGVKKGPPRWKLAVNVGALAIFLGVFFFGPGE
jgi:uncharacterized membrane protein